MDDGTQWDPAMANELTITDETPGHLAGNFNTRDGEPSKRSWTSPSLSLTFFKICDV